MEHNRLKLNLCICILAADTEFFQWGGGMIRQQKFFFIHVMNMYKHNNQTNGFKGIRPSDKFDNPYL